MERTATDIVIANLKSRQITDLDEHLPEWARRSHPVVRRHLGIYWKTLPPEFGAIARLFVLQAGLMAVTFAVPFLFALIMPLIAVSVVVLPLALVVYGQVLLLISASATTSMVDEVRNNTLDVLLTTPLSAQHIVLGKIAAAVWRQMENLGLLLYAAALFTLPVVIMHYASLWPPEQYPLLTRAMVVLALGSSLLRLMVEPIMVGAVGALVGAALPSRTPAVIAAGTLALFYFLFINLPRLLTLTWPMRLLIEVVLPLALPVLITLAALKMAEHILHAD